LVTNVGDDEQQIDDVDEEEIFNDSLEMTEILNEPEVNEHTTFLESAR
jgi:hypothetical protein